MKKWKVHPKTTNWLLSSVQSQISTLTILFFRLAPAWSEKKVSGICQYGTGSYGSGVVVARRAVKRVL